MSSTVRGWCSGWSTIHSWLVGVFLGEVADVIVIASLGRSVCLSCWVNGPIGLDLHLTIGICLG